MAASEPIRIKPASDPAARPPARKARAWPPLSLVLTSLLALSACQSDPITITPPQTLSGQVVLPTQLALASASVSFFTVRNNKPQDQLQATSTDSRGIFGLELPRHESFSSDYLIKVESPAVPYPFYGFASNGNVTVDLASTALYELIAGSPADLKSFTSVQIDSLLSQARALIQNKIDSKLIEPNASIGALRKAYRNALQGNPDFDAAFRLAALTNGQNVVGYVFYGTQNSIPSITDWTPKILTPSVSENAKISYNIATQDADKDLLFFVWKVNGVRVASGSANFDLTPDFDTVPWNLATRALPVSVTVSDGGLENTQTWNVIVTNVARAPVFTSTATLTGVEEQAWSYLPTAQSPDGAPFDLSLVPGNFPVGMDLCLASTMQWQVAGTPCAQPNRIEWMPSNCNSANAQVAQIQAVDQSVSHARGIQMLTVQIGEINVAPLITSAPPGAPSPAASETVPWSYQLQVTDPQASATALPGIITGSNVAPNFPYSPGGTRCPDVIQFSFLQAPTSAAIDANTGLITWTPTDVETGSQTFIVVARDGHGGTATQTFSVATTNYNQPPRAISGGVPVSVINLTVMEDVSNAVTPFTYNFQAQDIDGADYVVPGTSSTPALSLTTSALPTGMTVSTPALSSGGGINDTHWQIRWPIIDAYVPPGGTTFNTTFTICDLNPNNDPLLPSSPPVVVVPTPIPHFCVPVQVNFIVPKRNIAPEITSAPMTLLTATKPWQYDIAVTDGNDTPADTLSFTLVGAPAGMTLTTLTNTAPNATARINWTPTSGQQGAHTVELQVTDNNPNPPATNHTTIQTLNLYVQELNLAPSITSAPVTAAQNGTLYQYNVVATDPNVTTPNNELTYSLVTAPSGMSIDRLTGEISWMPSVAQAQTGTASVSLLVEDGGDPILSATQNFTININYVNVAPQVTPVATQIIPVSLAYALNLAATDEDGDAIAWSGSGLPVSSFLQDNGDGTAVFTWTPSSPGTVNVTFYATDIHGNPTPLPVEIQAVNRPVFMSHPVLSANTNGTYKYELNILNPAGGPLTLNLDQAPGTMQIVTHPTTGVQTVEWQPTPVYVGNQNVTIRATDQNDSSSTQSFTILVKSTANAAPLIGSLIPSNTATVFIKEATSSTFQVNATDSNSDALHYAWYWDDAWIGDASSTQKIQPKDTEAGPHVLKVAVTDGAVTLSATFNVYVRDTVPALSSTSKYVFSSGTLKHFAFVPSAGVFATFRSNPLRFDLFRLSDFKTGPYTGTSAFAYEPEKFILQNDFAAPTYLVAEFSKYGDPLAASNEFLTAPNTTNPMFAVNCAGCDARIFDADYPRSGPARTVYLPGPQKTFFISPTDPRYLQSRVAGVPQAAFDLGSGAQASTLILNPANSLVYVVVPNQDKVLVIDPAGPSLAQTINVAPGTHPAALVYHASNNRLYVYGSGSGSLTEIDCATQTVTSVTGGLGAVAGFPDDPPMMMSSNPADDVIYIALEGASKLITYDVLSASIRSVPVAASVVSYDPVSKRKFMASFPDGQVVEFK